MALGRAEERARAAAERAARRAERQHAAEPAYGRSPDAEPEPASRAGPCE